MEMTFQTGEVKRYDMASLFSKYPILKKLTNRELFTSGKLMGSYGIVWNDELDIEAETIYEDGESVGMVSVPVNMEVAHALSEARYNGGVSQKELAEMTGIDQSDISKLERGFANPSIGTLKRLAEALGTKLVIKFEKSE